MKYLLLLAIVVVSIMLIRWLRGPHTPAPPSGERSAPEAKAEDMVSCAQCGVHLPRSEALPGRGGMFCSEAHRSAFEQRGG